MRNDLKQFDLKELGELKQAVYSLYRGKVPNRSFWKELNSVIQTKTKSYKWHQKPKDDVVLGEAWELRIGEFYHKHTVHKFTYLYAEYDPENEIVIGLHEHKEVFHGVKQIKKVKEWYVFPDGKVEFCNKDKFHQLVNSYGKPIYVLSVKVMSNAEH